MLNTKKDLQFVALAGRTIPKILPLDYGMVGSSGNNYEAIARDAGCEIVDEIESVDGHSLPVHMCRVHGQCSDLCFDTDNVILFPPRHTVTSLYDRYVAQAGNDNENISLNTFCSIMKHQLPHISVFMRTRGICYTCFVYREIVRILSVHKLASKAEQWYENLDEARRCRHVYGTSQHKALSIY